MGSRIEKEPRLPHLSQWQGLVSRVWGQHRTGRYTTRAKDDNVSIFNGLDALINSSLGIDESWVWQNSQLGFGHKKTLLELCSDRGRDVDGRMLVHDLLDQVNRNWDEACDEIKSVPPNPHNWRRRQNTKVDPASTSDEVTLERIITQTTDGNWWNQVPVDHLLLGVSKAKVIDLVHRDGEDARDFEVIELKIGSADTPLSAASQLLKYGVVYAFYRNRYEELFLEPSITELLNANRLDLIVLAPWDFYQEFATCGWLARFETSVQDALIHISTTSGLNLPRMSFQFQSFPKTFTWSANMANNEQARKEVIWAIHHRIPVFTR